MERADRAPVATFYVPELSAAGELSLGGPAAHHARVRRLSEGDLARVTNGRGGVGMATIKRLRKAELVVDVESVSRIEPLPPLDVLPPVADRDRMLWLAEKCAELSATTWQPVIFARSRSVVPRGEGDAFAARVRARMIAALEQSGGAWLPEIRREIPVEAAASCITAPARYLLDRDGDPLDATQAAGARAVVFGPEGGVEPGERTLLEELGWRRTTLAPTTLRFETAGIAAVAILRAGVTSTNAES